MIEKLKKLLAGRSAKEADTTADAETLKLASSTVQRKF